MSNKESNRKTEGQKSNGDGWNSGRKGIGGSMEIWGRRDRRMTMESLQDGMEWGRIARGMEEG